MVSWFLWLAGGKIKSVNYIINTISDKSYIETLYNGIYMLNLFLGIRMEEKNAKDSYLHERHANSSNDSYESLH